MKMTVFWDVAPSTSKLIDVSETRTAPVIRAIYIGISEERNQFATFGVGKGTILKLI
jgi:hypothetical protein